MTRKPSNKTTNITTGAFIEHEAMVWLQQQGLQLVTKNYYCKMGEIDLIMLDQQQLAFIEVRYRKNSSFGGGLESVDWRKQNKLRKAAAHFLIKYAQYANFSCRFDVIGVQPDSNATLRWSWIKHAFSD